LPGLAGGFVAHAAPQVDNLLTSVVHATGGAQFVPPSEILGEGISNGLKAWFDMTTNIVER
jgi:hypothetical protein